LIISLDLLLIPPVSVVLSAELFSSLAGRAFGTLGGSDGVPFLLVLLAHPSPGGSGAHHDLLSTEAFASIPLSNRNSVSETLPRNHDHKFIRSERE